MATGRERTFGSKPVSNATHYVKDFDLTSRRGILPRCFLALRRILSANVLNTVVNSGMIPIILSTVMAKDKLIIVLQICVKQKKGLKSELALD